MSRALALLLCLLATPALLAANRGVEVRTAREQLLESEPGRVVIAAFLVRNPTSQKQEFQARLELPPGWVPVTQEFPFVLGAGISDLRLASFLVPESAPAGGYRVAYSVFSRRAPAISDRSDVDVVVLPLKKLETRVLTAPRQVLAGEDYEVTFLVVNAGNSPSRVAVRISSADGLPVSAESDHLDLAAGESRPLRVTVRTRQGDNSPYRHHLRLKAWVEDQPAMTATVASAVDVLPVVHSVGDLYHRIASTLTLRYSGERRQAGFRQGFQTEVAGSGTLDEAGKLHLDYLLRGPDTQDRTIYGEPDEYRLSHWTDTYAIHLGDRVYALSPLTEVGVSGRGTEGTIRVGDLSMGLYSMHTRGLAPEEHQVAAFADYSADARTGLRVNMLKKKTGMTVCS